MLRLLKLFAWNILGGYMVQSLGQILGVEIISPRSLNEIVYYVAIIVYGNVIAAIFDRMRQDLSV